MAAAPEAAAAPAAQPAEGAAAAATPSAGKRKPVTLRDMPDLQPRICLPIIKAMCCTVHTPSSIKIKSVLPTQLEMHVASQHVSYHLEGSYKPLANIDMWCAQVRQQDRLLKLLQDPQLTLLLLLLLQQQKRKATALTLSSWLPCHQRFRLKSWSSRDESGVCESGNDSNSKQLLQRRRSVSNP